MVCLTFSEAIKQRIKELCKEKNMNINMLAVNSGLTPSTVKSIFSNKYKAPNTQTLYYICIGLNIELKQFFDDNIFNNIEDND